MERRRPTPLTNSAPEASGYTSRRCRMTAIRRFSQTIAPEEFSSENHGRRLKWYQRQLRHCLLCPRRCGVNRTAGEEGFCRLPADAVLQCALPHHGEEPPLSGQRGAGTLFFSSCNLGCRICQNYQISRERRGQAILPAALAGKMLELQARGCHNIEPVTPTPHLPALLTALALARARGLTLPVVYNCGGYERAEIIARLAGIVAVYLPDFKYGTPEISRRFCGVADYPAQALRAIREMIRQTGTTLRERDGIAVGGIIIRHLVLPGLPENSLAALKILRDAVPAEVPLSLMAQYTPIPAVADDPPLNRRLRRAEYERIVNKALDLGFEHLFVQEVSEETLQPDFQREAPFLW